MPIARCSAQKSKSLLEFYSEWDSGEYVSKGIGKSMLNVIELINTTFKEFAELIIIAMHESESWKKSEELKKLYLKIKNEN